MKRECVRTEEKKNFHFADGFCSIIELLNETFIYWKKDYLRAENMTVAPFIHANALRRQDARVINCHPSFKFTFSLN